MKRFLLSIAAITSLLAGSSLSVAPASAAVFPNGGDVYYTVGDVVNLDLGCQEQGITSVYFLAGTLPDGLTMNDQGLVTGSPTTVGDFKVSNYNCYWGSSGVSWGNWYLTFHIAPMTTPEPVLGMHNLNTENCSFYVGYLFPQAPDSGNASIAISNQAGTIANLSLTSQNANQLYETTYLVSELNDVGINPNLNGSITNGAAPFSCGDTISATLSYQWRGAPAGTKTVSGVLVSKPTAPPTAGGHPTQKLINLNNADCQFRVLANIPAPASSGSIKLTIVSPNHGTDQITFTLADSMASSIIDFTFSPEELSSGTVTREGIVSTENQISTPWACGTMLAVQVDYRDLLDNFRSSTLAPELQSDGFTITPTKPTATATYSITASPISQSGSCTVGVTVSLPDEARPIAVGIAEVNSTAAFTGVVISEQLSANGTITVVLSFDNPADNSASVPIATSWAEGEHACSGSYKALLDSPGGILATAVFSFISEQTLVKAVPLNNSNCEFKVLAALPQSADPGSMQLKFKTTGASLNVIDAGISDSQLNQVLEASFNPADIIESVRNNTDYFYDWESDLSSGFKCNDLIELTLEFEQSGVKKTKVTTVVPTRPDVVDNTSYSITAFPSKTLFCAITVIAKAPDASRPLTLAITSTTSEDPQAFIYYTGGIAQEGIITATLSMSDLEDFSSSIPYAEIDISPLSSCSGDFRAVIVTGGTTVASDLTSLAELPVVCGAGWTINLERTECLEAPRGFYTESINSLELISCPAGMTTEKNMSKSINDCYKPIAQVVVGLSTPKPLKFKGTLNVPILTNAAAIVQFAVTGVCSAKLAIVTTIVKGKKIPTRMLKVTAGSKAGICKVQLNAPEKGKYLALTKLLSIKVSKTGK